MVHGSAGSTTFGIKKNMWAPAAAGTAFDLVAHEPALARTLPRLSDHRQQHRRAECRGVRRVGDRRRSFPHRGRVSDAVQAEADAGIGRVRRDVVRSDLREGVRRADADSVDAAVHRERRSGGRLLLQLLVRLHRHHQLVVADRAAADDPRPARGFRSAVRRRDHAGSAQGAATRRSQHSRLRDGVGRRSEAAARRGRSRAPHGLSGRRARDRAADCRG